MPRLHPHHPERQLRALLRRVLPAEDVLHGEPVQGAAADGGDVGGLGAADLALPGHHLHGHGVPLRRPRQRHHLYQPHLRGLALRLHHRQIRPRFRHTVLPPRLPLLSHHLQGERGRGYGLSVCLSVCLSVRLFLFAVTFVVELAMPVLCCRSCRCCC